MIYRFMSMIGLGIILLSNAVYAQRAMNADAVKDYPNRPIRMILPNACLLYTSDAADDIL
jgi:hypothetical protein